MAFDIICGFDEAGRGALAGPVSAACVILPQAFPNNITSMLKDSKKLSPVKRSKLCALIKDNACWGQAFVNCRVIDKINILQASLLCMQRAFYDMILRSDFVMKDKNCLGIVDGIYIPNIPIRCQSMVKADSFVSSVMAASIIAKVMRDEVMLFYDKLYPDYEYAKHKAYPTKRHKELCRALGASFIQRMTFNYKK